MSKKIIAIAAAAAVAALLVAIGHQVFATAAQAGGWVAYAAQVSPLGWGLLGAMVVATIANLWILWRSEDLL